MTTSANPQMSEISPHSLQRLPTPAARVPDFFIVGHHKCGTTALYLMLKAHPQIYMPELKEPKFFATDMPARLDASAGSRLPQTLDEYLALFAPAGPDQRVGEASPSYLTSRTAASGIAELAPAARIIAILREPASFLRSYHLQLVQSHVEREKDLHRALALERIERGGRVIFRYSDNLRYVEQLRRYDAAFSPEQLLVLIYDDFRRENEATVRRVLRFLEVDERLPIVPMEANQTVTVRSVRADELVRAVYAGRGPAARTVKAVARAMLPADRRGRLAQEARRRLIYGAPGGVDERLMAQLRSRYKPEVVALSEYLGRDLVSLWGYDTIG